MCIRDSSKNDFGMNIIPALLRDGRKMYAYHFNGYWRDVGTIYSLWEANMEVLDPENSGIDIYFILARFCALLYF